MTKTIGELESELKRYKRALNKVCEQLGKEQINCRGCLADDICDCYVNNQRCAKTIKKSVLKGLNRK